MELRTFQVPDDDSEPFSVQSLATKGEFTRAYSEMCSTLRLNNLTQSKILEFMHKFNPSQSLPIKKSPIGNFISTVKSYTPPSNRLLEFETCVDGCVVFSDVRYKNLRRCPVCRLKRFNECTLASCKGTLYDDCPHSDVGREAKKYLFYRPLIPLLIKLLEKPDFIVALNYKFIKQFDNHYEDVQDGLHYKENYESMDAIYNDFCRKNSYQKWIKINILLSQFYDGVKLFDSKVVDFWPLLITILNLPPTLRNKTGVGTFLISMFSNTLSSASEKYLFENCFIQELQELYKGLTINNTFFLQVRLIQHCLDTKAVGKQLNTHEANSLIGCPLCRDLPGSSRHSSLHKVVYSGFRILLPINNVLRYIGRSKLCCPPGFYGLSCNAIEIEKHRIDNIDIYSAYSENFKKINENLSIESTVFQQRLMNRIPSLIISCIPNSEWNNSQIKRFYLQQQPQNRMMISNSITNEPFCYQWFHGQIDDTINPYHHSKFSSFIYFVHCDLRPVIDLVRRTHADFSNDGIQADNLSIRIPIKDRHVNGLKGSWPFRLLQNANIRFDMAFDGFHCLFGMAKHIIAIIKGDKATAGLTKYCVSNNIFPFLFANDNDQHRGEAPWILTPIDQRKVDAWIDAILIPKSYSENFQIDRLFAATGYVRGKSFIDVFSILINYLNLAMSTIPEAHKNFFSMLGSKFRDILAFTFSDEKVEKLHHEIIETLCVYEGLFSEKECMFIFHEFLHLSRHIPIMGPLYGWWTFSGERTMSLIKKFVPIGGQSFDKTCMNGYNMYETAITENAFCHKFYENDARFSVIYDDYNMMNLQFDFQAFYFFSPISFKKPNHFPEFNAFEQDCLINVLLSEIYKIADNHLNAVQRSSFYRLFCIFNVSKINIKSKCSFKTFLFLVSLFSCNNGGSIKPIPLSNEDEALVKQLEPLIESSIHYVEKSDKELLIIRKNEIKTATSITEFLVFQNNLKIYKNAVIYGKRFSARDHSYAETAHMIRDPTQYGSSNFRYKPHNKKNNLQIFKNWSFKDDYSSWCRYRLITTVMKNNEFHSTINKYYGRLNYFFRINCKTDDILHGLGMANVAPRIFETIKLVDRIPGDEYVAMTTKEATTSYLTFIPITNIYPTPILISPFDKFGLPIVVQHKKNSLKMNHYSESNQLSYFLANDLKPSEVLNEEQQKSFVKSKYKIINTFSKDK
jgi:hypothetical protein